MTLILFVAAEREKISTMIFLKSVFGYSGHHMSNFCSLGQISLF